MKGQLRIEALFAFIMRDADGTEGVCGFLDPSTSQWMPLVGADLARVEALRPIAQQLARMSGRSIQLVFFKDRHDVEVVAPFPIGRKG